MDWFLFFVVLFNLIINAAVLNSNIKSHQVLDSFVKNTKTMPTSYKDMATRYNEIIAALNEMAKKGNNQADLIEAILVGLLADERLAPEALQWLTAAQQKMIDRQNTLYYSPEPPQN